MILNFPDLDTVRLSLTSGAVPAAVAIAPAHAGFGDDGRVWVEPSVDLPKKVQIELRRLGAVLVKSTGAAPIVEVPCWLALFPLQRSTDPIARPEQTPILFELVEGEQFSSLVSEVLRLGNDRQGFRWLEDPKGRSPARALLRVVGPPYYSLLRAIDRDGSEAPTAYVEQSPRVWVQLGYQHPLGDHIKPAAGKLLFLKPPRRWTIIDDAPFHDIYEVLEFALPGLKSSWRDSELGRRLTVPLRLTRGGATDAAELWVLRENAVAQLDDLVREADNTLIDRLAFAVGEKKGQKIIVLRVRPSRLAPPVLVLNAFSFCHFQKMPNLFLPTGSRLHPPLRRDAVRRHLADDAMQVTWLYPDADGGFTPESLPDTAFRPLSDWIDYILEHDHEPLQAWIESARFDFESFICDDEDGGEKPKKPPRVRKNVVGGGRQPPDARQHQGADAPRSPDEEVPAEDVFAPVVAAPPDKLLTQRTELEERFLAAEGGLDAPEREALWPELAAINARLGISDDAGICWMNAIWIGDESLSVRALQWFRAEAQAVPVRKERGWPKERTWASPAALAPRGGSIDGADLDLVLSLGDEPATADVRALAAHVFWAGSQKNPSAALTERLGQVGHFLETNERLLPLRAAWLAALGLHRLAGGDALGLARSRDRLLERLFHTGLRPEQDLPSFLRFSGPAGNQRFRTVRQWLAQLCERAHRWIDLNRPTYASTGQKTEAYAELFFSFGLARLGEMEASNKWLQRATEALHDQGEAHDFLLNAYAHRIRQAQQGKPHEGPLPIEYMESLFEIFKRRQEQDEKQGAGEWYIIDRLRQQSRILEPDQVIKPYRHLERVQEEVEQTLLKLPDILDRALVADSVRQLLDKLPKGDKSVIDRANILIGALNQAPRVGEDFALEMLQLAPAAFDELPPPVQNDEFERQATLLEKGLFVAAHFDCTEKVQQFVVRFGRLLQSQRDTPTVQAMDALVGQSFRGLRKLGMQEESRKLLRLMAEVLLRDRDLRVVEEVEWNTKHPAALRAMLYVAGAWYYFGDDGQAETVLRAARAVLLAPLPKSKDKEVALVARELSHRINLARAYASALSQAPVELAQKSFEELFEKLEGIRDTWTTHPYYMLSQLLVIEAVVLAVVSDDFTVGAAVRRWLDDDEYLVRRRIHREVRALVSN
jgi:hypothetical protein